MQKRVLPSSPLLKVLLIEDAPVMQEHLTRLLGSNPDLELAGVAATAAEGLAEFERQRPGAVVLDLELQQGNGLEVLREIRRSGPPCLVVIYTGHDSDCFRRRCLAAGADAFLSKNRESAELLPLLDQFSRTALAANALAGTLSPSGDCQSSVACASAPESSCGATEEPAGGMGSGAPQPAAETTVQALVQQLAVTERLLQATAGNELDAVVDADGNSHLLQRAQAALRESERKFREVVQSLPAAVYTCDLEGRITLYNQAAASLWGREPRLEHDRWCGSEKIFAADGAVIPLDTCPMALTIREARAVRGREIVIERPDGSRRTVLPHPEPLCDDNGAVIGGVNMLVDITERKQAEDALRESEERFRQLAENINQVFWLRDPVSHCVYYISPAYERIWGRPCADLLANPEGWLEAIHPEDRERVRESATGTANDCRHDLIYRVVRPDGSERWVHDRGFPVRAECGTIVRVAGLAEDITEQRRFESRMLRTQRLESIGTLAGGIAHDLNNVLTPILMSLNLLRDDMPAERRLELLDMVEGTAQRGAGMIKQLLQFARGVDGKRESLHPRQLLGEIERIVRETFPRTIELRIDLAAECSPVLGDSTQLQQVLLNLCVNARDAMPAGGRLEIAAADVNVDAQFAGMHSNAQPGAYVSLQVRDTGGGIPREYLEKIFDPFFTTKDVGKGTGLGLSTVQAIVRSHGGFVHVYSEPGAGSLFRIYLPASGGEIAVSAANETELPRGQGEWVLVVDDEETICQVTRTTLEGYGYRVLLARNGADAVALFADHPEVALVLTDMMMPVMGGLSAIAAIQHLRPGTPVIAASGLNSMPASVAAVPASVKLFLQKPYTAGKLLRAVRQALDG